MSEKKEVNLNWNDEDFQEFALSIDSTYLNQPFIKELDSSQAVSDFLCFRYILENAQTSIYRYATKSRVDALFDIELNKIRNGASYFELLSSIARIQNVIACGHSGWSHHPDFYQYRNDSILLFPFDLKVNDERVFINQNNSLDTNVQVGVELTTLNGIPIWDIIQKLKNHMVKDGTSAPNSFSGIENSFSNAFSNFVENSDTYSIELKSENGSIKNVKFQGLLKPIIDSVRISKYGRNKELGIPLRFEIVDSISTAVYTIKWFRNDYIFFNGQDFCSYTDSVFKEVEKNGVKHLIIDLRGNVGGWTSNGRELFSYFIKDTLPYIKRVESKLIDYHQFKPLLVSDPEYPDTSILEKNKNNLFEWKNYPSLIAYPQNENGFNGQVYILIDDLSRSCSAMFSSLMKEHTDAVFVGEENAATQCGSNAMVMAFKLPNSGITIFSSTAKYTAAVSDIQNSRGIIPDINIEHSQIPYALETLLSKLDKEKR